MRSPAISTYQPFTYLIGWSKLDRWYYGVRTKKGCSPSDLWTKYFTSSKVVDVYREYNGEPDVIEVRRVFDNADIACTWEEIVLRRVGVMSDPRWLNLAINGRINNFGRKHSASTLLKMSAWQKGRKWKHPMPEETRLKISEAQKGKKLTEQDKQNKSEASFRRWARTIDRRVKKAREQRQCQHCGLTCATNTFTRWHGDRCRYNVKRLSALAEI